MRIQKKIIIIISSISRRNGGTSSALDIAETLFQIGYDVTVLLTSRKNFKKNFILSKLYKINPYKTIIPEKNILLLPDKYLRVTDRNNESQIGFPLTIKKVMRAGLTKITQKESFVEKMLSEGNIILDCCRISGEGLNQLRSQTRAPIIQNHAGAPEAYEDYWLSTSNSNLSKTKQYINFFNQYDGILFQAEDQAKSCIKRSEELFEHKCYVVPPSCKQQEVISSINSKSPYSKGAMAIACVGSIQPRKSQHLALEAFIRVNKIIENAELHFVGKGINSEYGVALKEAISQKKLQNKVFLHGHREDYLRFMAHAKIILQPSKVEGVSRILREAMLLKTTIIGFSISGTISLLKPEEQALLVPYGEIDEMAKCIIDCLEDSEYSQKIAMAAYEQYLLNNSWAKYARNLICMIDYFAKEHS